MGRWKPGGLCWCSNCTRKGTIDGGIDSAGNEVRYCQLCLDRIGKALKAEAYRIALEMSDPPSKVRH